MHVPVKFIKDSLGSCEDIGCLADGINLDTTC